MTKYDKPEQITMRTARAMNNMTLKDASEKLGVHENTLRNWEKDSTDIGYHMAMKVADLYKLPHEFIFFGLDTTLSCEN